MKNIFKISLCLLSISTLIVRAESRLSVVKTPNVTSITVNAFTGGNPQIAKILTDTLINDLNVNGLFNVKTLGDSEAIFTGSCSVNGKTVTAQGQVSLRGQSVLSETATGDADPGKARRVAHKLADAIVRKLKNEPGIASTRIAFVSKKSGSKEIYTMDYDGYNAIRVTNDRAICGSPSIAKDGSKLAYTSYKSGFPDVYVQQIGGGTRTRVASFGGLNSGAAFSPDGGELAMTLSKDGNPELYTCSAGGGGFSRLTETRGAEACPSWSPDGSKIAYAFDGSGLPQIHVIGSGGGSGRALTSSGYNTEPTWAPNTGFIAFTRRGGGGFNIMAMNGDGSQVTTYTSGERPSWGPDGRHLIFSRGGALYILDVGSGRSIQLRSDLGSCSEPSWSGPVH
jgi:TolB protein